MPGGWPIFSNICNAVQYGTIAYPFGISVPPNATANTKGTTPTQITAATTQECRFIEVLVLARTSGTRTCGSVDIMIGAAASERIIMADLVATCQDSPSMVRYAMPLNIPVGTRIAARSQMAGTAGTGTLMSVQIRTWDGAYVQDEGYAGLDAISFLAASTKGTAVTPHATAGTKGSYVNLGSATARDYNGLIVTFDQQNVAYVQDYYWTDVAIGAGNTIIIPNLELYQYDGSFSGQTFYPVQIPAGTQLSARCTCGGGGSPAIGVTVYGAY
jgi:hypothetical protein